VRRSIQKEKSNKMQQCIKILLFLIYMKLNVQQLSKYEKPEAASAVLGS
jgi:hypothetical protein